MNQRLKILLCGALLVVLTLNLIAHVASQILPPLGSRTGVTADWDKKGHFLITSVDPEGPTIGVLKPGDEMIAIDGVNIKESSAILLKQDPVGALVRWTILREGRLMDVEFRTIPHKRKNDRVSQQLIIALFLFSAWVIYLLRRSDQRALSLAMLLGAMTGLMGGYPPDNLPIVLSSAIALTRAMGVFFFPIFVHAFLIFPERSPVLARFPKLERRLYLPFLLIILPVLGPVRFSMPLNVWALQHAWAVTLINLTWGMCTAYLVFGLFCLAVNYRAAETNARRRLRALAAGSAIGVLNIILLIAGSISGFGDRYPRMMVGFDAATIFTLPLIPLSFAYAIIRHKVLPISLIIRRGVRYLLVSKGSILLEIIAVSIVVTLLLTQVFERLNPPGIVIGMVSAVVGIAAWRISKWLHDRFLAPVIDRKFFRQSYDAQQIMAELVESMRTTTSIPQLIGQLSTRIQTALQTENVIVLLRDEATGDFHGFSEKSSFSNGDHPQADARFRLPKFSEAAATVEQTGQPLEIDLQTHHKPDAVKLEEASLRQMNSALLSPLIGKNGIEGIISVGPRLGDTPFSREDKRLLTSISGPTTFALENARLIERMMEDSRRRQELEAENEARAKELEGARLLQLSMLPQKIPSLPHLEIAAYMKPATEVGGDYYDFHLNIDGVLTIAVGDATGHGLKAGSVVTAVKGLFYSYADEPGPAIALEQSSRVLKQMNLRGLFMAMTMVKIRGREIQIASGGMPPALIYRAAQGSVEELLFKALPLGSLANYRYRTHETTLEAGDVLVLLSDGLPERFNFEDEMFDYPGVNRVLEQAAGLSAQGIIDRLIQAGDAWAAGRPQDDDVTFVVIKVV